MIQLARLGQHQDDMNIIKALIVSSLAGGADAAWKQHHQHATHQDVPNLSIGDPGSFVPLPP
jgi:hypothetical protein